jgi:hypothetical protein
MRLNRLSEDTIKSDDAKFIAKRKAGAAKIAGEAGKKGGYAQPTAWHFDAKLPAYDATRVAVDRDEELNFYSDKVDELIEALTPRSMTQVEFQRAMGVLEVWGEVYIQLRDQRAYESDGK